MISSHADTRSVICDLQRPMMINQAVINNKKVEEQKLIKQSVGLTHFKFDPYSVMPRKNHM